MLSLHNLSVSTADTQIITSLSLDIPTGQRVALMGPNGSGKSTLAATLAGHPDYVVTDGSMSYNGIDLLSCEPHERAQAGVFLAFQYPVSLPGVPLSQFLRIARQELDAAQGRTPLTHTDFLKLLKSSLAVVGLPVSFAQRAVNEGASGGEKKRLEMLQLLVLEPSLVIIDEIDSGLDVDALRAIGSAITNLPRTTTCLIITHYQRLLEYAPVDRVVILQNGSITSDGGPELAQTVEVSGYQQ
jgi:Fe-S cluster assembly ATP-binding protein